MSAPRASRILIVDDHADNLDLLGMILLSQRYHIQTARDGFEALDLIRHDPPDLVLLDIMMPRLSGYDVVRAIRGDEHLPYIPIMLITAKQELSDKVQGLEVGADDFLTKPVQSAELIAKVRALLRLKQVQDALIAERNKNELLYLVGQQLNATLDVDQVIGETLNLMLNMIGATQASVFVKDQRAGEWRRIMARAADESPNEREVTRLVLADGLAGLALRTRQPQLVNDTLLDDRWLPLEDGEPFVRTALSIPLVRDGIELGVLTLTHTEPHRFGEDQLPVVTSVAAQVISALHNASLYTQVKEAEAAREHFVHMLTHDLRAPLAGVVGCLHVLDMSITHPRDREFIGLARRACEAQEALISDILDVYRAESGVLELDRAPLALADLREAVVNQLAGAAAERNNTLAIDLPDAPRVVADRAKLTRVLINLVGNAIKFTRKGSITISAMPDADGRSMRFAVRDTGAGIAPEDVGRVFERFFQVRQSGARRGSGLGLDFCREVVTSHGGQIWAESAVNIGTTIWFTLPLEGVVHEQMALVDRR